MRASKWLGVAIPAIIGIAASADCATDACGEVYLRAGRCMRALNILSYDNQEAQPHG